MASKRHAAYVQRVAEQQKRHLEKLRRFRSSNGTVSHISDAKWQKVLEVLTETAGTHRIELKAVFDEVPFSTTLSSGCTENRYMELINSFIIFQEIEFIRIPVANPQSVMEMLASVGELKTELRGDSVLIYGYTRAAGTP